MPTEKDFRLQFAPASHQIKGLRQQRKHRLRLLRFMVSPLQKIAGLRSLKTAMSHFIKINYNT
jgi:hypothetical protein